MNYNETTMLLLIIGLGLALGSFLNVVICRLPRGWGEFSGSVFSRCPGCRNKIRWYDNIPLLSFIFLRGRCRSCGMRISPQYPLVEAAMGLAAFFLYQRYGLSIFFYKYLCFTALLLGAAVIDLKTGHIPDALTFSGMAAGIFFAFLCPFPGWSRSLSGLGLGLLVPLLPVAIYETIRKKTVMGGGDIKLMGLIGVFLGRQHLGPMLFYGSLAGLVAALLFKIKGRTSFKLPFAPFLAAGSFLVIWGPDHLLFL